MASRNKSVLENSDEKSTDGSVCKLGKCNVENSGNTNLNSHIHNKRKHPSVNIDNMSKVARRSMSSTSIDESDANVDETEETNFADSANQVVDTAHKFQTTLQNVSRPQSSLSSNSTQSISTFSGINSECSDIGSLLTKSTPSPSACSSAQSLNSLNLKQPKMYESLSDIKSYEHGGTKTLAITDALICMIAKDNMPLSTTEKPGFINFMRKTAPLYRIPSKTVVTNLLKNKYQVLSSLVKSRLSSVEYMTITVDIWTDILNTNGFLGMTVHFLSMSKLNLESVTIGVLELADSQTSSNICKWFEQILKEWGIQKQQVLTVVTDSRSNILSVVKKTFGNDYHLPCFAHALNLNTQRPLNELQDIQNIISKIKTIVTFFKQSISASDELKKVCDLKLKQSVPTRWNSIYYMIERFLLCSNHIASILITIHQGPSMLSADEIDIAKEISLILKPFEAATTELCGENYMSGSKIIPLINCLIKSCEKIVVINPTVIQLKSALLDNLQRQFCRMEEIQFLSIATLLDPRFKTLHLNNPVASSKTIRTIRRKILDLKTNPGGSNTDSSDDDTEQADNLWSFHNELVLKKQLNHFLNQPTIPLHENIFKFWKVNRIMYPYIAKIAEPYLSLVATSVPSKRLFSKAGNIMTAKLNWLKGEKLQQLLFLSSLNIDD